jgi:hypothetical protein
VKISSTRREAPVLKQFANLWTLVDQPSVEKEWTVEEKFIQAKRAGFEAIGSVLLPEAAALCKKYGMDFVCYIDSNRKTYRDKLEAAQTTRPVRINVQLCDHDTPPREAAQVWIKMEELARKMGLNVDLEVHRDTCTETPEKTYEIADIYRKATGRKIRFSWDFSHLAVVKHLNPPYQHRLLLRPDLIRLARQFHFRPFNGHHAQVPALDAAGEPTAEIKHYLEFLGALLDCWFAGAKGGEVVYACPEYGPVQAGTGYGISTASNVWKDACFVSRKIAALWKQRQKAFSGRLLKAK